MAVNSLVKNVTSAGTAERISATHILCSSVTFRAKKGNTTDIYIGDSSVADTYPDLDANQTITFEAPTIAGNVEGIDLYNIWVDADTNGEGVDVWYNTIG